MNTEIVQGIFNIVVEGIDSNWESIDFEYRVDETQSGYKGSYKRDGGEGYFDPDKLNTEQKASLRSFLKSLRSETQEMGKEPFTHCTLRFTSDGDFNIEYGYDPVDWTPVRGG